jgi:site-specific recombinase XerD
MFLSKRRGVYYLFFTDSNGKRHKRSTKATTKAGAVCYLRTFNQEVDARRKAIRRISLEDFSLSYLSHSERINTPKTVAANKTALNEFKKFLGSGRLLQDVSIADCERFCATKTADASVWTARKYYLALAAAFERAKSWGHITDNPWRKVKKPKTPEVLPEYFTREQFRALLAVISDRNFRELVTVAALTGLRRGELLAMQWDWVDLARRVVTAKNTKDFTTKSKKSRVVPLCDEVMAVLLSRSERENRKSGYVFHWEGNHLSEDRVSRKLKLALEKAELSPTLHWHSLRHTFASWLVQGGVSLYQVSKLLGHSSTIVTEKYAHLAPTEMHAVLSPLHLEN